VTLNVVQCHMLSCSRVEDGLQAGFLRTAFRGCKPDRISEQLQDFIAVARTVVQTCQNEMGYSLADLLETLEREGGVALYLSEGAEPVLALPARPPSPEGSSTILFPVEGPALTKSDIEAALDILKVRGRKVSYGSGWTYESRYRNGSHNFDVFVFGVNDTIRLEIRRPLTVQG
jgi:hypothetical protein